MRIYILIHPRPPVPHLDVLGTMKCSTVFFLMENFACAKEVHAFCMCIQDAAASNKPFPKNYPIYSWLIKLQIQLLGCRSLQFFV